MSIGGTDRETDRRTDTAALHRACHVPAEPTSAEIHLFIYLFRNSQLSTLYNAVKSRTEMTIVTTVRYQGNALIDTFDANRVQWLTLPVTTLELTSF